MVVRVYKYVFPIEEIFKESEPPALLRDFNLPDNSIVINYETVVYKDDFILTIMFREEE